MMEPSEHKEKTRMEENFSDLRVSDQTDEDDGLSRFRVNVRRQDTSMEEVFLGMFGDAKRFIMYNYAMIFRGGVFVIFTKKLPQLPRKNGHCT